jgi:hypothetical protein
MSRVLGRFSLLTSMLAAAGLLSFAAPVAALYDCCFVRSVPPQLSGVMFIGEVGPMLAALDRLGFTVVNGAVPGLGSLMEITPQHRAAPREDGFPYGPVMPSLRTLEMACGPRAPFVPPVMPGQANGANRLLRVTALSTDLGRACERIERFSGGFYPVPAFGPEFELPEMGARARESRLDWGTLRVIAPSRPDGPAARWLVEGHLAWIGFAVEVGDAERFRARRCGHLGGAGPCRGDADRIRRPPAASLTLPVARAAAPGIVDGPSPHR